MPITLARQPRTYCPNTKSRPVEWLLTTDDHVDDAGQVPFFQITFEGTGAVDGETVEIMGLTFEVQNGAPTFTQTTWSTTGSLLQVATNFADMLRCNYEFADFQFAISFTPTTATVTAFTDQFKTFENWTFDVTSDISITMSETNANGRPVVLKNYRIWYQVFEDDNRIGERKFAAVPFDQTFPFYGSVPIRVEHELRAILRSEEPDFFNTGAFRDPDYQRRVHLRYGPIEYDDQCNPQFGKTSKSLEVWVTNSVFQLHETREFLMHCPQVENPVRFLTNRPTEYTICRYSYEWIHIWIENTAVWIETEMPWYIVYTFYDANGNDLDDDYSQFVTLTQPGAIRIGMGPNNTDITSAMPEGTSSYEVRVFGWQEQPVGPPQLRQYSETITRHLSNCNCWAAEIYFLEDHGGWQTLVFETLEQREIDQLDIQYETPLNWAYTTRGYIYPEGERSAYVEDADQIFAFATGRIDTDWKRHQLEELLRSPEIYIRTANEYGHALRRVLLERNRYTTWRRGEAIHAVLTFRFSHRLRTH